MDDCLMPMKQYCPTCKGQAKVLSIGNMMKICLTCNGTGRIDLIRAKQPIEKPELPNIKGQLKRRRKNKGLPITIPEPTLEPKPFNTDLNVMVNTNNTNSSGLV